MGILITFNYSGTKQQFEQYRSKVGNVSKGLSKHVNMMRLNGSESSKQLIELKDELEIKKQKCSEILSDVQDIETQIEIIEAKQKENNNIQIKYNSEKADYILDMMKDYDKVELKLMANKKGFISVEEYLASEFEKTKEVEQ